MLNKNKIISIYKASIKFHKFLSAVGSFLGPHGISLILTRDLWQPSNSYKFTTANCLYDIQSKMIRQLYLLSSYSNPYDDDFKNINKFNTNISKNIKYIKKCQSSLKIQHKTLLRIINKLYGCKPIIYYVADTPLIARPITMDDYNQIIDILKLRIFYSSLNSFRKAAFIVLASNYSGYQISKETNISQTSIDRLREKLFNGKSNTYMFLRTNTITQLYLFCSYHLPTGVNGHKLLNLLPNCIIRINPIV